MNEKKERAVEKGELTKPGAHESHGRWYGTYASDKYYAIFLIKGKDIKKVNSDETVEEAIIRLNFNPEIIVIHDFYKNNNAPKNNRNKKIVYLKN